jgi:glutamine synthetase
MSEIFSKTKTPASVVKAIADNEIQFVDFWLTDTRGKTHHITYDASIVDTDLLEGGIYMDGSSIAGWKEIHQSDMLLMPDMNKITLDPFTAQPTAVIFCDVLEPETKKPYNRDPRGIAKAAEAYVIKTGLADAAYFGPEPEFFIFENVRFESSMFEQSYSLDHTELPKNSGKSYGEEGNLGHRPRVKGGYFPTAPVDSSQDLRSDMLSALKAMGLPVEKHHHEVASAQHELGIKFSTLVDTADNVQLYKHGVFNTAHAYGMSATFMPKPVFGDNGSGMHVHQSLFKGKEALFAGDKYAGLSDTALYYIGGIIKHAKAINAFTNPTTNSYKRLVPGYEAPVLLAYSGRNRSASCRIPHATSPKGKRVEVRFPDPTANPYLGFAAMLMAGLDGIKNKIHPGEAMDKNLYHLPEKELAKIPTVCGSLREALESLHGDHKFLLEGDVFTADMIEGYINLKMEEVLRFETTPHPVEFDMYYSA